MLVCSGFVRCWFCVLCNVVFGGVLRCVEYGVRCGEVSCGVLVCYLVVCVGLWCLMSGVYLM